MRFSKLATLAMPGVRKSIPMFTTIEAARTAIDAIAAWREEPAGVRSLQDYHK